MISAVHHISIIVSDEKSLGFYSVLGFKETLRKIRASDTVVLMEGHGMQLELFVDPCHPLHPTGDEPYGLRHFALEVDGTLEEEMERMNNIFAEPIDFGPIMIDWTGKRFCFLKDPDGLPIELRE